MSVAPIEAAIDMRSIGPSGKAAHGRHIHALGYFGGSRNTDLVPFMGNDHVGPGRGGIAAAVSTISFDDVLLLAGAGEVASVIGQQPECRPASRGILCDKAALEIARSFGRETTPVPEERGNEAGGVFVESHRIRR